MLFSNHRHNVRHGTNTQSAEPHMVPAAKVPAAALPFQQGAVNMVLATQSNSAPGMVYTTPSASGTNAQMVPAAPFNHKPVGGQMVPAGMPQSSAGTAPSSSRNSQQLSG
jgi:hypothetical protein